LTPEQHNKYLAYAHLGYGAFFIFFMTLMVILFWAMMSMTPDPLPVGFILIFSLFMLLIWGSMTVPSIIAGYGLLKRKKWAKVWAMISAVVAASNVPFGTAVTVYTFWFLFSEPGKQFYEPNNYALPPGRQNWANQQWDYDAQRQRQGQYNPPPPPPDWR
jgi:hypothetical protein